MKLAIATILSILGVLSSPSLALAHAGHGRVPAASASHYLAEPAHLGGLIVLAIAVGLVAYAARRTAEVRS